jgi:hypothetical protein
MATRSVKITVTIEDGVHGDHMGEASSIVSLRTDLLVGIFTDAAQDWYSAMVSSLGTLAYRDAFPRSGRELPVQTRSVYQPLDVAAALADIDRLEGQ